MTDVVSYFPEAPPLDRDDTAALRQRWYEEVRYRRRYEKAARPPDPLATSDSYWFQQVRKPLAQSSQRVAIMCRLPQDAFDALLAGAPAEWVQTFFELPGLPYQNPTDVLQSWPPHLERTELSESET